MKEKKLKEKKCKRKNKKNEVVEPVVEMEAAPVATTPDFSADVVALPPAIEPIVEEEPIPVAVAVEEKTYIVNCPKCNAALEIKENGKAYVCPGCRTLFCMRKSRRIVKPLAAKVYTGFDN